MVLAGEPIIVAAIFCLYLAAAYVVSLIGLLLLYYLRSGRVFPAESLRDLPHGPELTMERFRRFLAKDDDIGTGALGGLLLVGCLIFAGIKTYSYAVLRYVSSEKTELHGHLAEVLAEVRRTLPAILSRNPGAPCTHPAIMRYKVEGVPRFRAEGGCIVVNDRDYRLSMESAYIDGNSRPPRPEDLRWIFVIGPPQRYSQGWWKRPGFKGIPREYFGTKYSVTIVDWPRRSVTVRTTAYSAARAGEEEQDMPRHSVLSLLRDCGVSHSR